MSGPSAGLSAPSSDAAAALLRALIDRGVRHVVLSPGSRSQALALAAAAAEEQSRIRLHVRIDERVAGFTALGIGAETGTPAAVICTSGTAVANLLPAVLEADHGGVPMVLLTADRPPELRGVGANQTTRQPGIFGDHVRWSIDLPVPDRTDPTGRGEQTAALAVAAATAVAAARGERSAPPGPVHLNVPVREPLAGPLPAWFTEPAVAAPAPATASPALPIPRGPRTVVIAGAGAGPDAERIAYEGSWPLVAEIISGARFGPRLVHGYRSILAGPLGRAVQRAVVFGHPTLSRETAALLARPDVEVIAVRGPGERLDLNGVTIAADAVEVGTGSPDRDWLGAWMTASRAAAVDLAPASPDAAGLAAAGAERRRALDAELAVMRAPVDRAMLVDAVWRATWPHDRLVFGSSRLVRVADQVLGGKKVPVRANRGLAGIDGTIATAVGVALASQDAGAAGVTRVLLGDLAFLHDVGALLTAPAEGVPRVQIVVGNDGGGTIFDTLEVASVAGPAAMDRVMYTPHGARIAELAAGYGWRYLRATTRAELDQALTAADDHRVVEVPLPR